MVAKVGDSRAYLLRNQILSQLTLDKCYFTSRDSLKYSKRMQMALAQATDLSQLNSQEQLAFRYQNLIDGYLGQNNNQPEISVEGFDLQKDDCLVLTSDGVHDNLTNQEMEVILQQKTPLDMSINSLITAAVRRSQDRSHLRAKPDDMTAVAIRL